MGTEINICPNCGAHITFDVEFQKGKCDYCDSIFSIDELKDSLAGAENKNDELNEEGISDNLKEEIEKNTKIYSCPRCGSEIIADKTTTATFCCYCNGPIILKGNLTGDFRPSKVIPFKIDKIKAEDILLKWAKKRLFIKKGFTAKKELDKIKGIYIPYWLLDCNVNGNLSATGKKITTWKDKDYEYTRTDIYNIYRECNMKFKDVPQNASSKADDGAMRAIEPFEYSEMKDFSMPYLSGFLADKYDKSKEDVLPMLKSQINKKAHSLLRESISGYKSLTESTSNNNYSNMNFKYVMFPVWMLVYEFNKKKYTFYINGQTGEVYGALPVSKLRFALLFFITYFVAYVLIFAILNYGSV